MEMVAQVCDYIKTTEIHTLRGWILGFVNYITIFLIKKIIGLLSKVVVRFKNIEDK